MARKYTDKEIIEGLLSSGKTLVFFEKYLFEKFMGLVKWGQKKYFLNKNDSLDCYIDAFTVFVGIVKKGDFKHEKKIKPFLTDIFCKKCIDQTRRNSNIRNRGTEDLDEISEFKACKESPWDHFIRLDLMENVGEKLKKSGKNCQDIILLWAKGYSHKEIAILLPLVKNENTSRTRLSQCLKELRDNCEDLF